MANVKGSSNIKHSLLPPKCPFPTISPSFSDYIPGPLLGPKAPPKPRERNSHHLRTSSESVLVEEQPSWLDELLNEPETPLRKGSHRRSSSDSFTYADVPNNSNLNYKNYNMFSVPSWGSLDLENQGDVQYGSFYSDPNFAVRPKSQDKVESDPNDQKADFERKDFSNSKLCPSDTDTKRAKQQFAQRSRVRKLQYIAELERTVQVLQAEGCEVTAQLEFVNQQNLILSMENKALKQRLDSLAQEHLIKHLEQEVLEREIARLQVLFQHQQLPPPPPPSSRRRTNSRDLDSQFANLSLKLKDTTSGPLHI